MPLSFRPSTTGIAALVSLSVAVAPALHGQTAERTGAPVKGTWGAEAGVGSFGDGSVVRFMSPNWAVLVRASVQSSTGFVSGGTRIDGRSFSSVQAGIRRYHRSGLGLRPISGGGVSVGNVPGFAGSGGVYGEGGAAYLFNPHLALGAVGVVSVSRDGSQNTFSIFVPRVFASVFF